MQKFYAWADPQKFHYVKISALEGSKESFFVVL